ncbi:hypothetical protein PTKIN_Ptkin01aG0026400 [Pterospermum kingtungense]
MAVMSNQVIPQDIVLSILSLLPVKSFFRFKSVSKEWLSLINDPYFIKLQLKQSVKTRNNLKIILQEIESDQLLSLGFASVNYLDIPKELSHTKLVDSCNGILCLLDGSQTHRSTMLWNISTGEYKVVELPYSWHQVNLLTLYGFGYDSFNDDYKVVRIVQKETNCVSGSPSLITEVKVYSLKTNSWRSCEESPNYYILEKHHRIELLDNMERQKYNIALGALRGCFCAMATGFDNKVHVWMMKDYGVKESWMLMCCL